jgi:hypothetical protein
MLTVNFIGVVVKHSRVYNLAAIALLVLTLSPIARADGLTDCARWNKLEKDEGAETSSMVKAVWLDGVDMGMALALPEAQKARELFLPIGLTMGEVAARVDRYCHEHQDAPLWKALADVTAQFRKDSTAENQQVRSGPTFAITDEPPVQAGLATAPGSVSPQPSPQSRSPQTAVYPETGKIIRTTTAHSTFDVQNSETKQITSIKRDEPVMFLQTSAEILEIHDVARRRFHPLPAGSTLHFRISGNAVCMIGVPGKKATEEQCYPIKGREVRRN